MNYFSLNKNAPSVNFREATINGQAPDKGLYFPETIPTINKSIIENIETISNEEIAFNVIEPFVGNTINKNSLMEIVQETINFPIPLIQINEKISSLELFHGPTMAFKDIGARFMSRCLKHFVNGLDKKVTVLVATSGDTGSAVANGFYNIDGIEVVILYPSGKVSNVQEKQLTTLGNNITALEINGNFDDCQTMVKSIFADVTIKEKLFLTSANSINVARWLPQQFYYFFAYKQWENKNTAPIISVPSGNVGNICAGLLAKASGLPIKHFIAACNANDTISHYLQTNQYLAKKPVATISNAMDVGDPSNFVRILQLFKNDINSLKETMSCYNINDADTTATIQKVYNNFNYLCDTHGAVAYNALELYLNKNKNDSGIFLETAHPIKFYDVVEPIINTKIPIPSSIQLQLNKENKSIKMEANVNLLKEFLLNKK